MLNLKKTFCGKTERGAAALRVGLKIPTGNSKRLLGSGGADIGATFDGRYRIGRDFTLYFNFGGVLTGKTSAVPNRESGVGEVFLGLEYHFNRRDSFFAQIDSQSPFLRTGNSLQIKQTPQLHLAINGFSQNNQFSLWLSQKTGIFTTTD